MPALNVRKSAAFAAFALLMLLTGVGVAQVLQTNVSGPIVQVASVTTSDAATYNTPSGAFTAMPETSLNVNLRSTSTIVVKFSARGSVAPPIGSQLIPIVFIRCQIDSQPCEPDTNPIEFLYPEFCCDTRAFFWVNNQVPPGSHQISILWGMGNPTEAVVTNRALIAEISESAAGGERLAGGAPLRERFREVPAN
jgi:hypothetical protein